MKFSIIIPIFNAEKYIHESVASVLNQTYKDYEIILVDDGSIDKSAEICDSLVNEFSGIIKVIHQKNKGQLLSRCAGVEAAQGDYCVCLDADDLLDLNCLEKLADVINEFLKPDIVIYNLVRLNSSGENIFNQIDLENNYVYEGEDKNKIFNILMSNSMLNSMCNKCVKRECLSDCIEEFSEYQSLRCGEDRIQVLEAVARADRILFIDDALYCYRLFDGSITRNFDFSQINKFNMKILYEAESRYLSKWGMVTEEWLEKLNYKVLNETLYTFSNFYKNAKSKKDRKMVIDFDWDIFLPENYALDKLSASSSEKVKVYNKIKQKKYLWIRMYFLKKTVYKILRNIKRSFLK